MEARNKQNEENTVIVNQTESTTANLPAEPVDDMELNEEQLDIISGGGDGSNPFVR